MAKPLVALAMPRRNDYVLDGAARGLYVYPTIGKVRCIPFWQSTSLLDHCFNLLWCQCHNMMKLGHEFEYFAILHDDICPDPGWVDVLIGEMEKHDADFISAIVPIKDDKGLTSTAVAHGDGWVNRRLTLNEVYQLPETFGVEEAGGPLLLNTGCCVLKLRGPWLEHPEMFLFDSLKRVFLNGDGRLVADVVSEDWYFTSSIAKHGGKLLATRKVKLHHEREEFTNDKAWGRWQTDQAFLNRLEREPIEEMQCA